MPKRKNHEARIKKQGKRRSVLHKFLSALTGFLVIWLVVNQFVDLNPHWQAPNVLKSKNGVLNVSLNISKSRVNIGGKWVDSIVYNNKYIDDTWQVTGGDTIKVHLANNSNQPTNLHLHGLHISPKGNSDNVLLDIKPGESFDYVYQLSKNHPPGLYWYHPHLHHYTDEQVSGGMVGAIEVAGNIDNLPGIKGVPQRLLVLTTDDKGNNVNYLVNNQKNPTMFIRPFETLRLRMVNASGDDFYNIHIPGQKLHIISRDGNTLSEVQDVENEVLSPGQRIEILFKAGVWGNIPVESARYNQGFFVYPKQTFMRIQVAGLPVIPKPLPTKLIAFKDLRNVPVDNTRTLTFSEGGTKQNTTFLLDGKEFNPNVVNQVMTLGTVEQWNLVNNSGEAHPFHIHINPFQVISVNGKPIDRKGYEDTFPIPAHGTVVIKTQYKDFTGKYVLHCHILFHEDNGMMQLVEVVDPKVGVTSDNGVPTREGMPEKGSPNRMMRFNPQSGRMKTPPTPVTNYMKM